MKRQNVQTSKRRNEKDSVSTGPQASASGSDPSIPSSLDPLIPSSIVPFPLDTIVAVEEQRFQKMKEVLAITSIDAIMLLNDNFAQASPLEIKDGVGVITVDGPMTKNTSFFQLLFGGASYTALREALAEAMGNDEVHALLWLFDSPGGFADGLAEMGDAMLAAQEIKPSYAQVVGTCASAAYYMGCCTGSIFAQRMDLVGSIGVRSLHYDYSRMFAKEGIEAVVSDTGKFKSAGALGTEITERQREYFQSLVEVFNKDFLAVVARGRAMKPEKVAELADGRVYPAKEAATNGLIDGIQTFEETLAAIKSGGIKQSPAAARGRNATKENGAMETATAVDPATGGEGIKGSRDQGSEGTTALKELRVEPKAATIGELKAALPGVPAAFLVECLEKTMTMDQAKDAAMELMRAENAAANKKIEKLEAAADKPGVEAVGTGTSGDAGSTGGGDAASRWNEAVDEKMKTGKSRADAIRAVVHENPGLQAEYVAEHNAAHGRGARTL